jgi:hypothetical protein
VRGIAESLILDRLALAFLAMFAVAACATAAFFHASFLYAALAIVAAWGAAHLHLSRRRDIDPAARMAERAAQLSRLFPAAFVVMGHTHVPVARPAGDATYVNLGSWAEHESDAAVATRTHLVIRVGANGAPDAELRSWSAPGPRRYDSDSCSSSG